MLKLFRVGFAHPPQWDKNLIAKFFRAESMATVQKIAHEFARGEKYTVTEEKEYLW